MRDTILVHLIMFGPHNLHNLKVLTEETIANLIQWPKLLMELEAPK